MGQRRCSKKDFTVHINHRNKDWGLCLKQPTTGSNQALTNSIVRAD